MVLPPRVHVVYARWICVTSEDRSTSHISHCCEVGTAPLDEKFVRASVVGTPEGSYFTFHTGGNGEKNGSMERKRSHSHSRLSVRISNKAFCVGR